MTTATLARKLTRLEALAGRNRPRPEPVLAKLRTDPTLTMRRAGMTPDLWQEELLRSAADRVILLACRQSGKTRLAAALALNTALLKPRALVLLLSPSERQSGETAQALFGFYDALRCPVPATKRTELQLHLQNGSRVIALPDSEKTVRGYSGAALLVVDEASRVSDELYKTVRPMLAVSRGRLLALSTPFGKQGWFWEAWERGRGWCRVKITADQCPRITPEFLAEERLALGPRWFEMEYRCTFSDLAGAVFSAADIARALQNDVQPFFLGGKSS